MEILRGIAYIGEASGISHPQGRSIMFTEKGGTSVSIPLSVVIRLYEIARYECERRGNDWEKECERILNQRPACGSVWTSG